MQNEIWKDIKGFEGCYQVSNFGRVKSLQRTVNIYRNGNLHERIIHEFIMRQIIHKKTGYSYIFLSSKKRKNCTVHRLVLESFIPNSENKAQVNHKNGIKTDNRIENLEWSTISENQTHAHKIGLKDFSINGKPRKIVLDKSTGIFWSTKDVSKLLGKSLSNTLQILNGSRTNKTTYSYV